MNGVGIEPPPEYVDYILMRHIFHCTPGELHRQDITEIKNVLDCMEMEAQVKEFKDRVRNAGGLR